MASLTPESPAPFFFVLYATVIGVSCETSTVAETPLSVTICGLSQNGRSGNLRNDLAAWIRIKNRDQQRRRFLKDDHRTCLTNRVEIQCRENRRGRSDFAWGPTNGSRGSHGRLRCWMRCWLRNRWNAGWRTAVEALTDVATGLFKGLAGRLPRNPQLAPFFRGDQHETRLNSHYFESVLLQAFNLLLHLLVNRLSVKHVKFARPNRCPRFFATEMNRFTIDTDRQITAQRVVATQRQHSKQTSLRVLAITNLLARLIDQLLNLVHAKDRRFRFLTCRTRRVDDCLVRRCVGCGIDPWNDRLGVNDRRRRRGRRSLILRTDHDGSGTHHDGQQQHHRPCPKHSGDFQFHFG